MRLVAAAVAGLLLVAACSDDDAPESTTTTVEAGEEGELADFVLPAESVGSIAAFAGVVAQPLDDVQVVENPDPRGPCGGESPAPPLEDTAGRSFTGEGVSLVQVVAEGPDVDEYVEAQLADIGEPCGPYESQTGGDTTQTVDQIQVVALPEEVGYFSTSRIAEEGGPAVFAGSVVLRIDGVASIVFALSVEPIPLPAMESLTLLVDAALRAR